MEVGDSEVSGGVRHPPGQCERSKMAASLDTQPFVSLETQPFIAHIGGEDDDALQAPSNPPPTQEEAEEDAVASVNSGESSSSNGQSFDPNLYPDSFVSPYDEGCPRDTQEFAEAQRIDDWRMERMRRRQRAAAKPPSPPTDPELKFLWDLI